MSKLKFDSIEINIMANMSRTLRQLEKMVTHSLEEFSLTKPQLDVLFILKFSENNSLKATEIAEELFVSKANISGLISRLESSGFIERTVDPIDTRARRLILTEKAKDVLEKIIPKYFLMTEEIMKKFSKEEKNKLLEQVKYIESCVSKGGVHA